MKIIKKIIALQVLWILIQQYIQILHLQTYFQEYKTIKICLFKWDIK